MTQCHNSQIIDNHHNHAIEFEVEVKQGLDYILSLLQDHQRSGQWPRTISTRPTAGRQIRIYSKEEALEYFKAASYLDCRIGAYPYWRHSSVSKFVGIKNLMRPDLIMIDLDICNFQFDKIALKAALRKTLRKINRLLSLKPTVIWSGNGYHVYVPINAVVLEDIKQFAQIEQVSTKFLRFAEWYLSYGLSDSVHNNTVSLSNCMLRIPGSLNSKSNTQVKTINKWDGKRPNINLLIGTFCAYLKEQKMKELKGREEILKSLPLTTSSGTIQWIERLLQTPIHDHRKFAIWRILAPYLINVKRVSKDEAYNVIENWLNECDKLNPLSFYPKSKIREGINGAARGYYPISFERLKIENSKLYKIFHLKS